MKSESNQLGRMNRFVIFINNLKICRPFSRWFLKFIFHIELPSKVPKSLKMGHPYCIVVHSLTIFGENVTIGHFVTIGEKLYGNVIGVPTIEDDVTIYPNCVLFGGINIGKCSIIGAGSLVNKDVSPYSVVAGNPAKRIGSVFTKDR